MKLDELLVELGFEYDPEEMKDFKKDLDNSVKLLKGLTTAAIAGAVAITGLTVASTKASDEQGKLADEIGETVDNIAALQFAQQRAGGSTEEMTSSLRDFSIRAAEAARGTGSALEALGILGISATGVSGELKPLSSLLLQVSQRFQGLSRAKQIELADKLGLRGSIRLLQQGPEAIQELIKEAKALGVTTAEDAKIAADFQDSLTDLWAITKQVSRTISRQLAPILTDLVNTFTDWWKSNRELIEQRLPEWVENLAKAFKIAALAVASFLTFQLLSNLTIMGTLIFKLVKGMLLFNASAVLLPTLIGAIALAFVALVEDSKVFFEGGESFIGDMLEKYPKWADEIKVIAALFATIGDLTNMIFDGWSQIIDLFDKFSIDNIKEVASNLPGFLGDVTGIYNSDGTGTIPELGNSISNRASTVVDKVEILIQGGADTAENIADAVFNVFQQTSQDLNSAVDQ
jgi:TP901 family phage tail tape measure protein